MQTIAGAMYALTNLPDCPLEGDERADMIGEALDVLTPTFEDWEAALNLLERLCGTPGADCDYAAYAVGRLYESAYGCREISLFDEIVACNSGVVDFDLYVRCEAWGDEEWSQVDGDAVPQRLRDLVLDQILTRVY